jgi:nucleotide-binding universal stress UspA family protein
MGFKDLLVHVDATPEGLARVRVAADLAAVDKAYVTGLFLRAPPRQPSALAVAAGAYVGDVDVDRWNRERAEADKAAEKCEAQFKQELDRAGVKGEWQTVEAASPRAILQYAGCADLIIVGQVKPGAGEETSDLPGEIALACGRPVLVVPYAAPIAPVGDRVMIAWNGRRESIRAVHDALPLLERAKFVALFEIRPRGAEPGDLEAIVQHLARHGVKAERYVMTGSDHDAGQALLSRAENYNADLVVMGAYGHARLRELALGGATHTVLAQMKLPILLSH